MLTAKDAREMVKAHEEEIRNKILEEAKTLLGIVETRIEKAAKEGQNKISFRWSYPINDTIREFLFTNLDNAGYTYRENQAKDYLTIEW